MKQKKETEYNLTMTFPSEYAFTRFEWRAGKILKDGSGTGFGERDMSRWYKTRSGAEKAITILKRIAMQYKIPNVKFYIYSPLDDSDGQQ